MEYTVLTDEELLDLLYTQEDRLPRKAVDEFIHRGQSMVPLLSEIVSDQFSWTEDMPEWWAVVHASFILGAIGTKSVIIPLLHAARWADAFDCDWVTEAMPAMLGRIGEDAAPFLKTMAKDLTNGYFVRSMAMDALGVMAWRKPTIKEDISVFIYSIFMDEQSQLDNKQDAGNILLDLGCTQYRQSLLDFARQERERTKQNKFYLVRFFEKDVEAALNKKDRDIEIYDHDWLSFYDEKKISSRSEPWLEEENAETEPFIHAPISEKKIKIGRNEPCPCGSGKKYKKCCLPKEEISLAQSKPLQEDDSEEWGYAFFREYFPDIANRETRSISVWDSKGTGLPQETYAFHEMFCIERGCDCRRVFFYVTSTPRHDVKAVICYGWEPVSFYKKWFKGGDSIVIAELKGPCLNIGSPQSKYAEAILELAKNKLLCDQDYIERVKGHYKMFKERLDRPKNK